MQQEGTENLSTIKMVIPNQQTLVYRLWQGGKSYQPTMKISIYVRVYKALFSEAIRLITVESSVSNPTYAKERNVNNYAMSIS